jgi:hypothetical protein
VIQVSKFTTLHVAMAEENGSLERSKHLEEGDYYYSPEGYMVFTEKYHLKRGYCCQSGCKHCPFGFDKRLGKIRTKP